MPSVGIFENCYRNRLGEQNYPWWNSITATDFPIQHALNTSRFCLIAFASNPVVSPSTLQPCRTPSKGEVGLLERNGVHLALFLGSWSWLSMFCLGMQPRFHDPPMPSIFDVGTGGSTRISMTYAVLHRLTTLEMGIFRSCILALMRFHPIKSLVTNLQD